MDLPTIGTGAGSGLMGALLAFLGFRQRLKRIESELDEKIGSKTCDARYAGLIDLVKAQNGLAKETRDDVKRLLARK